MTEKRFTFNNKSLLKDGEFWLDGQVATICNAEEIVELLNELNNKNKSFKAEIEQLKKCYNNVLNEMDTLAEVNDKTYKENKELKKENEQLKSDNFNLNKSVECLDETVKEQCNKIDWADECGVRWEEEYEKWKG